MEAVKAIDLLLVEDDPGDVDLIKETMEALTILANLYVVNDGVEALAFLRKEREYSQAPTPDLIFLDLNMPGKDGREALSELKLDEGLRLIPVVVLTSSSSEDDVINSYRLGANCYVTKPTGLAQFMKTIQIIEEFWFTIVKLPTRAPDK
jgi:two-component system response regulator